MTTFRIALANVRYPATPDESVLLTEEAIAQAGASIFVFTVITGLEGGDARASDAIPARTK